MAWRTIHNFTHNPHFLLPSIIFPLFFFIAFAGGLSSVGDVPGFDFPSGYTAFQFVFVLLQSAAFGGVFTGFGIAADFENGFARRLLLGAPDRLAVLVGYALAALIRALVVGLLLFAIALATGMQVTGGGVELVGLVRARRAGVAHRDDVRGRRRVPHPDDPGRPGDADAGLHRALPRAGLRPAAPAVGLGRGRGEGQSRSRR